VQYYEALGVFSVLGGYVIVHGDTYRSMPTFIQ